MRHADLHIACAELAVLVQNGHGIALLGACHGLLGQSDHVISLGGFHADAHVQTRQQQSFGVGHFCTQRDLARSGVYRNIAEQQLAVEFVLRAIIEQHCDFCGRFASRGVLSITQSLTQLERVGCRLGEVHVDRVNLLNHGQRCCSTLTYQRTFCDQRLPNTARDGGGYTCVVQIDLGAANAGLGCSHFRLSLLLCGFCVDEILLANGIGFHQRAIAFELRAGLL